MVVGVLALALSLSLSAQEPRGEDLFVPRAAASRVIITAAGDVPGASGTHFRTDLHIINLRNVDQNVAVFWLPYGSSGNSIGPKALRLDSRAGIFSADFVASVLGRSGLGSIEFVALDDVGNEDPNGQLHVVSRIWTPEPNVPNGTMSQTFPAVAVTPQTRSTTKWIFGMRRDGQYRMNVGVVNTSRERQRFRITATPSTPGVPNEVIDFELPGRSMHQQVMNATSTTGSFQITIVNLSDAENESDWQAWASSIDNITGDAWSQIAFPAP
jgi:hypothetical protein